MTNSKEFKALSKEYKRFVERNLKERLESIICIILSSKWIHIWENLKDKNSKKGIGYSIKIIWMKSQTLKGEFESLGWLILNQSQIIFTKYIPL